jgi:GT2 family glycosyltransferase
MLSVVISSRNARNLMACVKRVVERDPSVEIIVLDDGFARAREDVDFLEEHCAIYPGIKPFIFARNCNQGIAYAGRNDVLLLNDDALLLTLGGFTALQHLASTQPGYGIIAAASNNVGNLNQNPRDIGLRDDRMVCFVAVLIPRRTIGAVGLLDERFGGTDSSGAPIYGWEDNDYCRRVRLAGLRVGIYDYCYVDHATLTPTFRADGYMSIAPGRKVFLEKWGGLEA